MNEKNTSSPELNFLRKIPGKLLVSGVQKAILCVCFLLAICSNGVNAQFTLTPAGPSALITCDSVQQTLTITKSTPFIAADQIVVSLDLYDSVNLINPAISVPGSVSVSNDTLTITGISAVNSFTITYSVQANCDYIIQQSGILMYSQDMTVNINGSLVSATKIFTITPSILVYAGGLNLNVTDAVIGQQIERTYVYKNTSSQAPFTGAFQFMDTLFASGADAGLRFDTVYVYSPNGAEINHLVTDTSVNLLIHVNDLVQTGDSLVIKELITMIDCSNTSFDNSQTLITAYYGCTAADICKKVAVPNELGNIIFAKIDPNLGPKVKMDFKYTIEDCYSDVLPKEYTLHNIGTDTASNVIFYIHQQKAADLFNLSTADTSTIEVSYFNGSTYDLLPYTIVPTAYTSLGRLWEITLDRKLAQGDSIRLNFDLVHACVDPELYDDISQDYFRLSYHDVYVSAALEHFCKPDHTFNIDYNVYFTDHIYSFGQYFNNLNAILGNTETAWYEVDNSSPLKISGPVTGSVGDLPYPLDSTIIEVHLNLQGGLGLTDEANLFIEIPVGNSTVQFNPFFVDVVPGPSGIGSGDTIIARFRFSDLAYVLSIPASRPPYVTVETLTLDYNELFNKFKVKFELQAYCNFAPSDGKVYINEQFLLMLNPSCNECLLPLESVSSYTNVNCPGCVLPGWNLNSFNVVRKNYGYADSDNNYLPDSYPQVAADPLEIDLKRAMIGDTLNTNMTGTISDGQDFDEFGNRIGYTFSSIGFNFDEGQLLFLGPGMKNLQFLGASGYFTHGGTNYPITIPASAAVYAPGNTSCFVNMDDISMQAYGISSFTGYGNGDFISINPQFRIVKNLTDNDGPDPYFGVQTINCFYLIGGEEFSQPLQYPEANDANAAHELDPLTGPERGAYQYWCTAAESRYVGVGYKMNIGSTTAEDLTFYWNYVAFFENRPSICNEAINYNSSFVTGFGGTYDPSYESSFSFPSEIREFGLLDSLTFNFPDDYEVDKVLFINYNPYYDASLNQTRWDGNVMSEHNYPRGFYRYEYDLSDAVITSTSVKVFPAANMDQITQYPYNTLPDSSYLWLNGETKLYGVTCLIKPKSCQDIPKHVPYPVNLRKVTADYSKVPLDLSDGDSSVTTGVSVNFYSNYDHFTNHKPVFAFQPLQNYLFSENGTVSWDASFSSLPQGNIADNQFSGSVENAFLSFFSPTGNFEAYAIPDFNTYVGSSIYNGYNAFFNENYNYNINKFDTIYNDLNYPDQEIFGVGYMGTMDNDTRVTKRLRLVANFDCSALPPGSKDSIGVIMGWNCFDYPSSIEEACYIDTTYLVIEVPDISMNVTETLPASVNSCDTAHFSFLMDVAGIGEVNDLLVTVENGGTGTYQYLPNSGQLQILNNTPPAQHEPVITDTSWQWNLSDLSDDISENDFIFSFDLLSGCKVATTDVLDINIYAENFCGKVIVDKDYHWFSSNDEAVVDSIDVSHMCEETQVIDVTLNTGGYENLDLQVYSAETNQLVGSLNTPVSTNTDGTFTIPVSTADTALYLVWSGCSCSDTIYFDYTCHPPCEADASFSVENTCKGDTITTIPTQTPGTHQWTYSYFNLMSSAVSAEFPAGQAGVFTITHIVTSDCGSSDTVTKQITVYTPVFSSIVYTGSSPMCSGDSALVTVNNADQFVHFDWNTGDTTSVIWITSGGYYHVNVTDTNGCVSYCPSITVTEVQGPASTTDTLYVCSESTLTNLDAGTGFSSYEWSTGAHTQSIQVSGSGVYTVTVCDSVAGSCCGEKTYVLLLDSTSISLPDFALCPGDSQVVVSPVAANSYEWSSDQGVIGNSSSVTISDTGSYALTITSVNGCEAIATFGVTPLELPVSHFNAADTACVQDTVCFAPDVNLQAYSQQWVFSQNGSVIYSSDTLPCVHFEQTGTVQVELIITNQCGSSSYTDSISIIEVPSGTDTLYICSSGDETILDAAYANGTYNWNTGETSQSITVHGAGAYSVAICNQAVGTCCGEKTFVVILDSASFTLPDLTICPDTTVTVTSPIAGASYTWYYENAVIGHNPSVDVSNTGTYSLNVISEHNCSAWDEFEVFATPLPVSSFSINDTICTSDSITCFVPDLNAAGFTYHWIFTQNGSSMHFYDAEPCVDFSNTGNVQVELIVSNECASSSTTQQMTIIESPSGGCIEIIGQNPMCPGDSILLTTTGNYTSVNWENASGETIGTGTSIYVHESGVYSATATDVNGCVSTCICTSLETIDFTPYDIPDTVLCNTASVTHTLPEGMGLWSNGNFGVSQTFNTAGNYYVDVVTEENCNYRDSFDIVIPEINGTISIVRGTGAFNCQYTMTATITGSPIVSYTWMINGVVVSTSSSPTYVYNHTGVGINATVTLLVTDIYGCSKTLSVQRKFNPCIGPVGGGHVPSLIVAPNPFSSSFTLSYNLREFETAEVKVIDVTNKVIYQSALDVQAAEITISTENLSTGVYIIQVIVEGKLVESQRIVKSN
ncbi:MAG: T9SS type A sorting domain-containing protein [Bacteroidota bacterium]